MTGIINLTHEEISNLTYEEKVSIAGGHLTNLINGLSEYLSNFGKVDDLDWIKVREDLEEINSVLEVRYLADDMLKFF